MYKVGCQKKANLLKLHDLHKQPTGNLRGKQACQMAIRAGTEVTGHTLTLKKSEPYQETIHLTPPQKRTLPRKEAHPTPRKTEHHQEKKHTLPREKKDTLPLKKEIPTKKRNTTNPVKKTNPTKKRNRANPYHLLPGLNPLPLRCKTCGGGLPAPQFSAIINYTCYLR